IRTTLKRPFHFRVGVVVQHRLHHRQLVVIGIQQALDDWGGEGVGTHENIPVWERRRVLRQAASCISRRACFTGLWLQNFSDISGRESYKAARQEKSFFS